MRWDIDWIEKRAQLTPFKSAIIDGDTQKRWSYREINQRAHSLACFFMEQGIKKGDRVALLSPNDISYFDFIFACLKIGAIFVPLNWRLSVHELNQIIEDCTPKLLGYHSRFNDLMNEELASIQVDHQDYEAIFINQELAYAINVDETHPWTIIYTGGTTGKSKGVVLTHANIQWNALNTIVSWNLSADDVTLTYLPMFHTGGLNALTIPILVMGGTVLFSRDFDAENAIHLIEKESCTILLMVPTMYHLISQTTAFEKATFQSVKTFLSGGAPCPLTIYEAFSKKGIAFKEGYGLTEAGPNNFYIDPNEAKKRNGSIGKPMMFNKVKILKTDGSSANVNEVGELLLDGNHVFDHYWNNKEATRQTIIDGWLHTGDLAKFDEEGYFYIVGRKKEMIITGGENVYPLEVEQCIQNHPAVFEVAVVGLAHPKWGEAVTAFISVLPGQSLTLEEIQQFCLSKLGKYKVPKYFNIMRELPKTHVGKIDKKYLQTEYQSIVS
ncbi:class I adenylate-forming enzyme family protein [Bacillus salitolerans]|uniref:Class I adenylate-forming enzyme family protein n=1 Tax=Bacillus salitolerans TaxID=1437434 RepID=A0ABW4LJF0_9BACI